MPVPLSLLESGSTKLQFPKEDDSTGVDFTGRVIDSRYRVIRKIGEGGMGTVYAGEHVEIGKDVAIKILHPAYSTQQDLVERFRREARAASRIGHPHIIDVTDFGETEDGCAYFVMEHLDGIDLADVLSHERRLAPERACKIATQICRALAAAHAAGVIHRDLKPENIFLVARDGQADFVKVLDFGIARSMGRARRLTNPGRGDGDAGVHGARAGGGGRGRSAQRHLFGRRAHLRDGLRLAAADVARQGADPAARDQGRRPRGAGPHRGPRAGGRIRRCRYQSMAQFEYDLVKSLFGRSRAVSEMLGLHDQERGVVPEISYSDEAPGGTHPRADSPLATSRRAPSPVPPPAREEERGQDGRRDGGQARGTAALPAHAHRRDPRLRGRLALRGDVRGAGAGRRRRGDHLPAAPLERARADGRHRRAAASPRPRRRATPIAGRSACAPAWPTSSG